ncbi:class I SAM-dependent methyltransferase [Acutalibacter muris]|jgi:predicted RNA methylase|uniref:class I SAM-dependent methyltransferase n=1 Tax=Acutalibacter muris TaxID=1796620 RepID=UPI0026F390F0|nr:class I SAM-dependent methyltransferase [Acutalibacter muris]
MSRIADNILSILGECRVEGDTLFLPDRQLDRPTYQAVNKVLVNIGGKWNRKAKGHVFADGDPAELLNNVLMTGETVDLKKQYQFFPTPRPVAEQMCRMAELDSTCVVLEPSCGKGDLADVVSEAGVKVLYGLELNRDMERYLKGKPYTTMVGIDFLDFAKDDGIDHEWNRIVMNPPFTKQQDIDHILAAYDILAPGGILVSVVSDAPFFWSNKKAIAFREFLDSHGAEMVRLDEGAFKKSGTMVRTRLIKLEKPRAE